MSRVALLGLLGVAPLAGCFSETDQLPAGASTGADCAVGASLCPCTDAGTCDAGLTCLQPDAVCVPNGCTLGELDCPCDAGACAAGLVCDGSGSCIADAPGSTSSSSTSTSTTTSSSTSMTAADTTLGETTLDPSDGSSSTGPHVPSAVYLYFTNEGEQYWGGQSALGNARDDTTALCDEGMATLGTDVPCQTSIAIIVASQEDTVDGLAVRHGLPSDLPVLSAKAGHTQLKENFPAMVALGADVSLETALVAFADSPNGVPQAFHTGSLANGIWESGFANCQDWTAGTGAGYAGTAVFDAETEATRWLNRGATLDCGTHTELLCACW